MEIHWDVLITHTISFILALLILKKYAWGPLLNILEERRNKIKAEFQQIDDSKAEVDKLHAEYEAKLRDIDNERRETLTKAVNEGKVMAEEIKANAQGGLLAAPAWAEFMRAVYERRPPPAAWQRPEGLMLAQVDATSGYRATDFCPRESVYFEWYIPGTAPSQFCPYHNPLSRIIAHAPNR